MRELFKSILERGASAIISGNSTNGPQCCKGRKSCCENGLLARKMLPVLHFIDTRLAETDPFRFDIRRRERFQNLPATLMRPEFAGEKQ